jgi:hypothetical protein
VAAAAVLVVYLAGVAGGTGVGVWCSCCCWC